MMKVNLTYSETLEMCDVLLVSDSILYFIQYQVLQTNY